MVKTAALAATPLFAALAWAVALIVDDRPFGPHGAFLLAVGALVLSTVALVGMTVVGGRWAHRLGVATVAVMGAIAVTREIDPVWVLAVVATAGSLTALASPGLAGAIRKLPAASGPPPRAVAAPLILLVAPCLLGLSGASAPPALLLVVGLGAPVAAWCYARVIPGGLFSVRIGWPLLALGASPLLGMPAGLVSAALGMAVAVSAWHPAAKASYHPPREVGTAFPIPPELTPPEVLETADLDERGRPRR